MKRLTFIEAAITALALSVVGAVLAAVLTPLFGVTLVSRALCLLLALAYVLFLLARSRHHHGRVTLLAAWALAAVAITLLCPTLFSMVAAHLTLVWLTRALLMHTSVFTAMADLLLCGLSLAAGCWAFVETASVFAGLWSLGLVQAACSLLPLKPRPVARHDADQAFTHAARAAEQALRAFERAR
ncbi:MAG: hypothetical protein IPM80_07330 [Proteobacteria bacterium]|nr:hypothetical protein [Pseudomonadota bacterium]